MWQRNKTILTCVSMAEMFRNGMVLLIVCASPFEIFPIWLLRYKINVILDHRPILMMVVSLAPCSFRYMPPPSMREWTLTRSGLITEWWSSSTETENRMAVMRYVGVTVAKGSLLVTLYLHIYNSVLPPLVSMWWIRRARYLQGQRSEVKD